MFDEDQSFLHNEVIRNNKSENKNEKVDFTSLFQF